MIQEYKEHFTKIVFFLSFFIQLRRHNKYNLLHISLVRMVKCTQLRRIDIQNADYISVSIVNWNDYFGTAQ